MTNMCRFQQVYTSQTAVPCNERYQRCLWKSNAGNIRNELVQCGAYIYSNSVVHLEVPTLFKLNSRMHKKQVIQKIQWAVQKAIN